MLWNNQPDREAFGLVRKGVGQSTVLRAVETPYPKVNPIQSSIISYTIYRSSYPIATFRKKVDASAGCTRLRGLEVEEPADTR